MKKTDKKIKKSKKTKKMSAALSKSIALILIIAIFLPVVAYNLLPEWVYYLTSATRLSIAGNNIADSYGDPDFINHLHDTEISFGSTIEISDGDRLIYSTVADRSGAEIDLVGKQPLDDAYRNTYKITDGEITDTWGYLLRRYDTPAFGIMFLEYFTHTKSGELIEICVQVSETTIAAKVEILVVFFGLILCMLIAMFIIMQYVRWFTKRIRKVEEITANMSRLDFSEKCPPQKFAELDNLSRSINDMSASLDYALTELRKRNDGLQRDIENERTIDELRKTFISGISHELKTPIAIIAGYAEGAKTFYAAGNTEVADRYCDTIAEEAERMNNMIMKLLEITRYDSGAYTPLTESFNIHDEVQEWFDRNAEIIKEKGIKAVNNIPHDAAVLADRFLIASNVNNYLSNAVSHVEGDMVITASLEEADGKARVCISNTGKQIADRDIEKIWTSFYRADKSLSRKQGRFGLGLATVASIQKLHGEKYGVENTPEGVKFWFDAKRVSLTDALSSIY